MKTNDENGVKRSLIFRENFPITAKNPLRVDTLDFTDATTEETFDYFTNVVEKMRSHITMCENNKEGLREQIDLLQKASDSEEGLHEEIIEKNAIIKYLENKITYNEY